MSTHRSLRDAIARRDGGIADTYWTRYYTAAEADELISTSVTTMVVCHRLPIHVRIWPVSPEAPTVVMAHGLLPFGLVLLRPQLALFHAGFNVVQWDLPGFGLSGGPRGGCTIPEIIETWTDIIGWAHEGLGDPLFTVGFAEDGVTSYYAAAADPRVTAMSVHILTEYGDPDNVRWMGPDWLIKLQSLGIRPAAGLRPSQGVKVTDAISFDVLFGPRREGSFRNVFDDDPLRTELFELRLASSMLSALKPPVPFQDCRMPIQVVASENNRVWPYSMVKKYFDRLGGPKELVTLEGAPHWDFNAEFENAYCEHVVAWFRRHVAAEARMVPLATGLPIPLRSRLTIGRDASNDLVLDDDVVSRFHAEIAKVGQSFLVADLGSRNGVLVNGVRISPQPDRTALKDGDLVQLGSDPGVRFRFELSGAAKGPSKAAEWLRA